MNSGASKWVLTALALLALAVALLLAFGQWRWGRLTQGLLDRLQAASARPSQAAAFTGAELHGLPPVVQRFFRAALKPGAPMVAAATLEHTGSFNMGTAEDQWKPFTSRQRVVARQRGFVWDARVSLVPGLAVHVHDAYVGGEGVLHAAILGAFTVADLRGGGEVARGELMRFFAEAPWYPTALLPSEGVRWAAIDERSATATITERDITLTLTFTFGADGLIESVRSDARGRAIGGQIVMRPWEGRFSGYEQRGGMMVPMAGEVAWLLPPAEGGRKPYWRGTIRSVQHELRGQQR